MELRTLTENDADADFYLSSQAFAYGERDMTYFRSPRRLPRVSYGVWDEHGLQAKVAVIPFQTHFGPDAALANGGIASVVCLPASRGRGYAGAGMQYLLRLMHARGYGVSMLSPFDYDFYRHYGWEWAVRERRYTVPARLLPASPETEFVRAITTPADRDLARQVYTRLAGRYRGMLARNDWDWNEVFRDKPDRFAYAYLYERDGSAEGYLTYRGGKADITTVPEFIPLTPRAQAGLLGLLRRHEMQIEAFRWDAPADDTLWSRLTHWKVEARLRASFMARIVNVAIALEQWKPNANISGEILLEVRDEFAPWNAGVWRVTFAGGRTQAALAPSETPQVRMDVQALSQAYLGVLGLDDLRAADRVEVEDEAGFAALKRLLEGPPMWMNEDF